MEPAKRKKTTVPTQDEELMMARRAQVVHALGRDFYLKNEKRLERIAKELRNSMEIDHFLSVFQVLAAIKTALSTRPGYNVTVIGKPLTDVKAKTP